jgi:hypothetical protein
MAYTVPEGWKEGSKKSENSAPINSVGQPQLKENEIVIEDGEVRTRQYFLVQCEDGKIKAVVPGVKDGKDYTGTPKKTRQDALQDAFNILNTPLPDDYLSKASKRTPNKAI